MWLMLKTVLLQLCFPTGYLSDVPALPRNYVPLLAHLDVPWHEHHRGYIHGVSTELIA